MIIEMVAAQIGKGPDLHRQAFGSILRKAMAGRFENRVTDPLTRQA